MSLSSELSRAIEQEIQSVDRAQLARAAAELTQHYWAGQSARPAITTQAHRAAYLAARFPATFAANLQVFTEIQRLAPDARINSLLDLGAGPGTALFAAIEIFPQLTHSTLVEADRSFIELARRLSAHVSHPAVREAKWIQRDVRDGLPGEAHDLVVISYTLSELQQTDAEKLVLQAWSYTKQLLVIIEPGTTRGFGFVHAVRALMIGAGGHIVAPCPHAHECPMAAAGDWCHFAARVQRTSLHRQIKH